MIQGKVSLKKKPRLKMKHVPIAVSQPATVRASWLLSARARWSTTNAVTEIGPARAERSNWRHKNARAIESAPPLMARPADGDQYRVPLDRQCLGPMVLSLTEPARQLIEVISIQTPTGMQLLLCTQPGTAEVLDELRDRNCFFTGHEPFVSAVG